VRRTSGPEPIPRKKLTTNGLAAAIRAIVDGSSYRQRAEAFAHPLREVDAVGRGVSAVEAIARVHGISVR
jgi:UDP:flavonoid glycosyltransferase YjiC (YdhE family)